MKKLSKYISLFLSTITLLICIWFLFANINTGTENSLLRFSVYIALTISVLSMLFLNQRSTSTIWRHVRHLCNSQYMPAIIVSLALIIGMGLRFLIPLRYPDYHPISDPRFYHGMATTDNISDHNKYYIQEFPYVLPYSDLLRAANSVLHNAYISSVILNTVIGLLSASIIYLITRNAITNNKRSKLIGASAFALCFASPFEIIFSALTLPVVVTNLLVLSILLIGILLIKANKNKPWPKVILLSIIFGLLVGVGNYFRPIMTILAIALIATLLYMAFKDSSVLQRSAISIAIIVISMILGGLGVRVYIHNRIDLQPTSHTGGWSFFVGSNIGTTGRWNQQDKDYKNQLCSKLSQDDCQTKLYRLGVDRYKSYGILGSLVLYVNKMHVFAGGQTNIYNTESIAYLQQSKIYKLLQVSIIFYLFALFTIVIILTTKQLKSRRLVMNNIILFVSLTFVGVFISAGIMEVSQRYAQPVYPILLVLIVCLLGEAIGRTRQKRLSEK